MAFDYGKFVSSGVGKQLATALGLDDATVAELHRMTGAAA